MKKINQDVATPINIEIPKMQLTIADLAFLKGVESKDDSRVCNSRNYQTSVNRLEFMGLIKMGEILPCPDKVKTYAAEKKAYISQVTQHFRAKSWDALYRAASKLNYLREPKTERGWMLTESGKQILKTGSAQSITAPKAKGCL